MPNGQDHDLLIRIETKLDGMGENFREHCDEESKLHGVFERDIKAAHRRIDWLTISGVLALLFFAFTIWTRFMHQ